MLTIKCKTAAVMWGNAKLFYGVEVFLRRVAFVMFPSVIRVVFGKF